MSINDEYNFKLWHVLKQSQINPDFNGACVLEIFSRAEEVSRSDESWKKFAANREGIFKSFETLYLVKNRISQYENI